VPSRSSNPAGSAAETHPLVVHEGRLARRHAARTTTHSTNDAAAVVVVPWGEAPGTHGAPCRVEASPHHDSVCVCVSVLVRFPSRKKIRKMKLSYGKNGVFGLTCQIVAK